MLEQIFLHQKQFSLQLRHESIKTRIDFLNVLERSIENHIPDIVAALAKDFSKPETETLLSEIYPVLEEIRFTKKHLKKWTKARRVNRPLTLFGTKSYIIPEPRGVCLIIAPWNYPFQLALLPLVSAIAAGNCAIIKPSETTIKTSALIHKIISATFADEHVKVVEGGIETVQELLHLPFDHIFFTGSTRVGKIVMAAASKHLSSITLELGGKSPVIVDNTANLELAAEKIVWGKFLNAGQTCIAPDYLFVHHDIYTEFKEFLIKEVEKFYGKTSSDKKNSPDYSRIASVQHTERLRLLIQEAVQNNAELSYGGDTDAKERYVSPTLIEKVNPHSGLMKEEIFGPILPIIPFHQISDVIHSINEGPKPLALYIYSHSKLNIQDVLKKTSSGGMCINDNLIHFGNHHLPFGGVGDSGMGNYHGYHGFKTFSHEKAVLIQSRFGKFFRIMYPPYTDFKRKFLTKFLLWRYKI